MTARTPTSGSTGVSTTASITATFSESVNPSTISFVVTDSGGSVAGSTAYNPDTNTVTFTPTGGLDPATTYTVTVSGAKDHAGNTMAADSWSFTTTSTVTDATIWPVPALPTVASSDDSSPQELGVKFRSDIAGYITGVRFYKGAGNTGTHVGHLWTASGTLLATATFTSETTTGWQQVNFAQPVQIEANTTYVASYFAPNGGYSFDGAYFASAGIDSGVLHALSNAAAGGNGVFRAGSSGFPNSSFNSANYWVDVVFSNTLALGIAAKTPAADATGVSVGSTVTATFTRAMNPTTVNSSTFRLRAVGASSDVPATVTYSGLTATLTPTQPLALNTTYQVTVSGSMTAADGTPLGSDTTWSFTTQPHLTFTDTTVADFAAGTPDANVVFVETGNGEAILKPIAGYRILRHGPAGGLDGHALERRRRGHRLRRAADRGRRVRQDQRPVHAGPIPGVRGDVLRRRVPARRLRRRLQYGSVGHVQHELRRRALRPYRRLRRQHRHATRRQPARRIAPLPHRLDRNRHHLLRRWGAGRLPQSRGHELDAANGKRLQRRRRIRDGRLDAADAPTPARAPSCPGCSTPVEPPPGSMPRGRRAYPPGRAWR